MARHDAGVAEMDGVPINFEKEYLITKIYWPVLRSNRSRW
jgi:hypothetical protein